VLSSYLALQLHVYQRLQSTVPQTQTSKTSAQRQLRCCLGWAAVAPPLSMTGSRQRARSALSSSPSAAITLTSRTLLKWHELFSNLLAALTLLSVAPEKTQGDLALGSDGGGDDGGGGVMVSRPPLLVPLAPPSEGAASESVLERSAQMASKLQSFADDRVCARQFVQCSAAVSSALVFIHPLAGPLPHLLSQTLRANGATVPVCCALSGGGGGPVGVL
jgi:hypothetical protein